METKERTDFARQSIRIVLCEDERVNEGEVHFADESCVVAFANAEMF